MTLMQVLWDTRAQFEKGEIPQSHLAGLYQKYHRTENIALFLERAKALFPKLNCGVAMLFLQDKLGKGVVVNGKYGQNDHTFLKMGKSIIDITADQFGGPKIYVGPIVEPWIIK